MDDDLIKSFLFFDISQYRTINDTSRVNDTSSAFERFDSITHFKVSFVLGVLPTIDNASSEKQAQFMMSCAASRLLFKNKVELLYKDM
jgi:hypothetical protein